MPYYENGGRGTGRNYFIEFGSGRPVVLLHGLTSSGRAWGPQLEPLVRAGFRIIVPDLAGHGASGQVDRSFGIDALADDVVALLAHLEVGNADVVGLSLGGMIALHLALERPDLVGKVVAANSPDTTAGPDLRALLEEWASILRRSDGPMTILEQSWPMMVNETFRLSAEGLRTYQVWHGVAATAHGPSLARVVDGVAGFDLTDRVGALERPALIIAGEKDAMAPPEIGRRMARSARHATYVELAGASHISSADSTENFNRALTSFLL